MYILNDKQIIGKIHSTTFTKLAMTEADMENIIEANIDMIADDEESMLVIGKQVRNEANGRSDLTAVDRNGNIVLIEIKRDKNDVLRRKEGFEFQAIRYAASYATIESVEEAVRIIYAPYIENFKPGNSPKGILTSIEQGTRNLADFLKKNDAWNTFNQKQRIILIASDYDAQTLSAVAWLNQNGVDISCFKMIPYQTDQGTYLQVEKILPLATEQDFLVNLLDKSTPLKAVKTGGTKRVLPKISDMLEWGVVKEGDLLIAKGRESTAKLLANGNVMVGEEEMSMQTWLKQVYRWASVDTYTFAQLHSNRKSLSDIREEYMLKVDREEES